MKNYTRIMVQLSKCEYEALQNVAMHEYRNPREQARYLLREALNVKEQPDKRLPQPPTRK